MFLKVMTKKKINTFNDIKSNCMIAIHRKKCSHRT